jgi:hypothetical protein
MLANNTTEVVKEILKFMGEVFCLILFKIQWALLNKITDYGINWLMGYNLSHLTKPKYHFNLAYVYFIRLLVSVGYWNQFLSVPK